MPYEIRKVGNKHKVVNASTGRVLGSHPSRSQALAQLRAVYANTKGK